jgi:hypothetical protein
VAGASGVGTYTNGDDQAQAGDQFGLFDPSSFLFALAARRRADRLLLQGSTEEKGNRFTHAEKTVQHRGLLPSGTLAGQRCAATSRQVPKFLQGRIDQRQGQRRRHGLPQ